MVFEPAIGHQRVLDAAGQGAGVGRKPVARATQVIDEGVVPIAHKPADDAEPGAPGIDTAVEVLDGRESGVGLVVKIVGDIEMQPSSQKDRIPAVGALDTEAASRGFEDMDPRRWQRQCRWWWCSDDDYRSARTSRWRRLNRAGRRLRGSRRARWSRSRHGRCGQGGRSCRRRRDSTRRGLRRFQIVELFLQILDLRLVLLLEISHLGLVLLFHCSDFALQLFNQIRHIRRSLGYRRHGQSGARNGDDSGDRSQMSNAPLSPHHCPQGRRPGLFGRLETRRRPLAAGRSIYL
jgi:hypothetical protein